MLRGSLLAGPWESRLPYVAYFVGWRDERTNLATGDTRAAYDAAVQEQPTRARGNFGRDMKSVNMPSQCQFRYILYAGGVHGHSWSSRLKHLFLCGSVILWAMERVTAPAYSEFWYPLVEANVHFVPVTSATLWQVVDELEADPGRAAIIAAAGKARIESGLTPEFVYEYTAWTFHAWSEALPAPLRASIAHADIAELNEQFKSNREEQFKEWPLEQADLLIENQEKGLDMQPFEKF